MGKRASWTQVIIGLILVACIGSAAYAVAPTQEAIDKWKAEGTLEQHLAAWNSRTSLGIDVPDPNPPLNIARLAARAATGGDQYSDTIHVLVIMVDFSDKQFTTGTPHIFDSILFSDRLKPSGTQNPSGSMIDYWREVSYGAIYVHGQVIGPVRMSRTYAYYVGTDNGLSKGPELASDAVNAADGLIDYSQFAEMGSVKGVVILHPGAGAETGAYGIWSHMSNVNPSAYLDGVSISTYTVDPELFNGGLQPVGVFCHEHGHILGLPDLYDTVDETGKSEGLGNWSLMASGNYNGNSRYPAHPDPWCKWHIGLIPPPVEIKANVTSLAIPEAEFNSLVYRVKADTNVGTSQYWIIENREKVGFDYGLPGAGLLIYHVDPTKTGGVPNTDPTHYGVCLEQADGSNSLRLGGSRGSSGDPFPGATNNRSFTDQSNPNSRLWDGSITQVGVWNISNPDSIMHADVDYEFSRAYMTIVTGTDSARFVDTAGGGDGDGIFEPGETIEFFCKVKNTMRDAFNWSITLSTANTDVVFDTNHVVQGYEGHTNFMYNEDTAHSVDRPVRFHLKPNAKPAFATFNLLIAADSVYNSSSHDERFTKTASYTIALGSPQTLLVEDDNNKRCDTILAPIFRSLLVPIRTWNKAVSGSPTSSDLSAYKNVFWIHGPRPTGTLTADDITALKTFLNNGGRLCMASASAASQLRTLDSAFMRDYLHARYSGVSSYVWTVWGTQGGNLGDTMRFVYDGNSDQSVIDDLTNNTISLSLVSPGQVAFTSADGWSCDTVGYSGITYSGSYKTVFLTFPIEYMSNDNTGGGWAPKDTLIARILGFFGGDATGVDDPAIRTLPSSFSLEQNYPNPFNPSTRIAYTIPASNSKPVHVTLTVYNMLGEKVATLVDESQRAGRHTVTWNGTTDRGTKVASGVYLYRLTQGDEGITKKMTLLK